MAEVSKTEEKKVTAEDIIKSLEKGDYNIYFYAPAINGPSGGMGVLFKQALILKEAGYNVSFIYEPQLNQQASYKATVEASRKTGKQEQILIYNDFQPEWMEFSLFEEDKKTKKKKAIIDFIPLGEGDIRFVSGEVVKSKSFNLNAEDFLIIPEGFANIMEKTMQTPCKRIVLAQSWIYILNALKPGQKWSTFGIKDVISVSDGITEYLNSVMPGLNIKQYAQGISRKVFNKPENISDKFPMIAYSSGRGPESEMKVTNIIRNFQEWYPQYRFFRFMKLNDLSRKEYAERLKDCALALYTDDIAGFGTLPLESMACGTHVVGWTPFGSKEYISGDNGAWANNGDIFNISELLGIMVDKWVNGELDDDNIQENYEKTLNNYTEENEKESILKLYEEYKNERINEIKQL